MSRHLHLPRFVFEADGVIDYKVQLLAQDLNTNPAARTLQFVHPRASGIPHNTRYTDVRPAVSSVVQLATDDKVKK